MAKVVIAQHRLLHYRTTFFDRLHKVCASRGLDLHLVHGHATRREADKRDTGSLPWADVVQNRYIEIGQRDWLWQPLPRHLHDADLVVLMQENRLISNYPRIFGLTGRKSRVAFWGHGRNFQTASPTGFRERWKRSYVGRVDWWFAYTSMTRDILVADQYPQSRITVLDNAIDNDGFTLDLAAVDDVELQKLRAELDLGPGAPLGLFCGSLYPDKRLDLMVGAGDIIHQRRPDFRLVVIGDGPSFAEVKAAAATRSWLKVVGVQRGRDKAGYFKLADVVLNPGLVGLHVLDAFCAGLPMITTADARHSPEIAYLQDGINGLVCPGDSASYASAVLALLGDVARLDALKLAALSDSRRYTLDNMVSNFVDGIERCLAAPRKSKEGQ